MNDAGICLLHRGSGGGDRRLLFVLGLAAPGTQSRLAFPGLASLALFAFLLTRIVSAFAGRAHAAYGGVYLAKETRYESCARVGRRPALS